MTDKYYNRLKVLRLENPELEFQNKGYEYLNKEIRDKHSEQIEEISKILKITINGFTRFNNFKDKKEGGFDIRCQHKWDNSFTGVGYFDIEWFKNFEEDSL